MRSTYCIKGIVIWLIELKDYFGRVPFTVRFSLDRLSLFNRPDSISFEASKRIAMTAYVSVSLPSLSNL